MKLILLLVIAVLFLSGCLALEKTKTTTLDVPEKSQNATPIVNDSLTENTTIATAIANETANTSNGITVPTNGLPSISTSATPSNPSRGELFTLTVSSEDDLGVRTLTWESTETFSKQPESRVFECNLQRSCSTSWQFNSTQDGLKTITVYATDSTGQESSRVPVQITVQPFDFRPQSTTVSTGPTCGDNVCHETEAFETCAVDCPYRGFTCANAICEGGESYQSCPQDCSLSNIIGSACGDGACEPGEDASYCPKDCTSIKPNCGNNICNSWENETSCNADCAGTSTAAEESCTSNEQCGYKEICSGGKCTQVDCTNDAQCGYGKECEGNRCVRCPRGPYGPAC